MKHHDTSRHVSGPLKSSVGTAATPVLSQWGRDEMVRHLADQEIQRHPVLAHVMKHKISTAQRPLTRLNRCTVTGNCIVTYRFGSGPERVGLLCHWARTETIGFMPVRSVLGATLIGLRIGQSAPLILTDCSIERVRVLAVAPPSEASRAPRTGAHLRSAAEDGKASMEWLK